MLQTTQDLLQVLKALSVEHPAFNTEHGQRDLCAALAEHIKKNHKQKITHLKANGDVTITKEDGQTIKIFACYKGEALSFHHNNHHYILTHAGAQDIGRHTFLKKVSQMETLVNNGEVSHGFVILLTNDPLYWENSNRDTIDAEFKIHQDKVIHGQLNWSENAGAFTEQYPPLNLQGVYTMHWHNYSHPQPQAHGRLRVLIARIPA